ncbi:MAG: hypothetical protein ACLTZT_01375 [Butyricimonas faecalis]
MPRFKWNIRVAADYRNAFLSWQVTYIGQRFITTDQEYATIPIQYIIYWQGIGINLITG